MLGVKGRDRTPGAVRTASFVLLSFGIATLVYATGFAHNARVATEIGIAFLIPGVMLLLRPYAGFVPGVVVSGVALVIGGLSLIDRSSPPTAAVVVAGLLILVLLAMPGSVRWWGHRPRRGWTGAVLLLILAVLCALASASLLIGSGSKGSGLTLVLCASAALAGVPFYWPRFQWDEPRSGPVVFPTGESGLIFEYSHIAMLAAVIATVFLCAALVAAGFISDIPLALRVTGFVGAVLFGSLLVLGLRGGLLSEQYVVLLPSGIAAKTAGFSAFVPWDAITGIVLTSLGHQRAVGIQVSDRERIEISRSERIFIRGSRLMSAADLVFPLFVFRSDPYKLLKSAHHLLNHPEERPALAG
jgi:hypothetical protein